MIYVEPTPAWCRLLISVLCAVVMWGNPESSQAQTPHELRHINRYTPLQPYIPEHILIDRSPLSLLRSPAGLNPDRYSPNRQDQADWTDWEEYYRLFFFAAYPSFQSMRLRPEDLDAYADSVRYAGQWHLPVIQRVPVMDLQLRLMNLKHREIADSAIDQGLLTYDTLTDRLCLALAPRRIRDTLWFPTGSQPPFVILDTLYRPDTNEVLGGWSVQRHFIQTVLDRNIVYGTRPNQVLRLMAPSAFWVSNDSGSFPQIDLGDGLGWRRVWPGQLIQWQYQSFGSKTIQVRWIQANGRMLGDQVTRIPLQWAEMRWGNPDRILHSGPSVCFSRPASSMGKAVAFLKRSRYTPFGLREPVIIVEGFEGKVWVNGSAEDVPGNSQGFGDIHWGSVSSGVFPDYYHQLGELPMLLDSLERQGLDLVFVDFQSNHASVEKNAAALISLLEQIKSICDSTRIASGLPALATPLHVVGASMGGLIARVALRQMELSGCCHGVSSFGTLSTPHRGANLPLSAQHALVDGVQRGNLMGRMERHRQQLHYVLRSPAASQMLIYHYDTNLQQFHHQLMAFLDSLGLPTQSRNYAFTNGSLAGLRQGRHAHSPLDSIRDGEMAFAMDAGVWAPCTFPVPFRSFRNMGSQRMYLFRNRGHVVVHSPLIPAHDTVYRAGNDIQSNFAEIQRQYGNYLKGLGSLALNHLVHKVAIMTWPPWTPWFLLSRQVISIVIHNRFRSILERDWQLHLARNQLGVYSILNTVPRIGVDYIPGDYSDFGVVSADRFVQSSEPVSLHTFVSSVSALNLSSSPFTPVVSLVNPWNQTQFERWLSRPLWNENHANDPHAMVYKSWASNALDWMSSSQFQFTGMTYLGTGDTLDLGWHLLSLPYLPFNSEVRIPSLTLGAGSALRIHGGGPLRVNGVQHTPTLPTNSDRSVETGSTACDSVRVILGTNALMQLGRPGGGWGQDASVARFGSGSRLVLHSGSRLSIQNGYRLRLDTGTVLEVYPGAVVELQGDSSLLEIHGQVLLHPGARLAPTGDGTLWVQAMHPSSRWTFGAGAVLEMRGRSPEHRRLVIEGNWRLGSLRDSVRLESCRVRITSGSTWDCYGPVIAQRCRLGENSNLRPGAAWIVHGSALKSLSDFQIVNMQTGLRMHLFGVQTNPELRDVHFGGNDIGLETHSSGINLLRCRFRNNRVGWRGYDIMGISRALHSEWVGHVSGVDVMGQAGALLRIQECRLDSNRTGMFSFGQLRMEVLCSSFSRNETGWYAGNTQVWLGDGALNQFGNNRTALYLEEVDLLYLRNGGNSFTGSSWHLDGMLSGLAIQYLIPQRGGNYGLELHGNRMSLSRGLIPANLVDWDGHPLVYLGAGSSTLSPTCQSRLAIGGGVNYVRERNLYRLGRNFSDSLGILAQGLHEIANDGFPSGGMGLMNRQHGILRAWNGTCQAMEWACNDLENHSIVTQLWTQLSLEMLGWFERSGFGALPEVRSAQRRWTQWMDRCGQTMFRNNDEALVWQEQISPTNWLSKVVTKSTNSEIRWERIHEYWTCALRRDPHTASPCHWGPDSSILPPKVKFPQILSQLQQSAEGNRPSQALQPLIGPNPVRAGQLMHWEGQVSAPGEAMMEWFPVAMGMEGGPWYVGILRNGDNLAPDLPPGAYWVRIYSQGVESTRPTQWIIAP
jgi:hypothetical protein